MNPTPEPGLDLPTEPGVWDRHEENWTIIVRLIDGMLLHSGFQKKSDCKFTFPRNGIVSDLPRGGWLKATAVTPADPLRHKLPIARIRKVVEDIERMMRFTPPRRDLAESNEWYQAIRDAQDLLQDLPDESLLSAPQADQPTFQCPTCKTEISMKDRIVQSIAAKPEILSDLAERLNEPIVDAPADQPTVEAARPVSPPAPEGQLPRGELPISESHGSIARLKEARTYLYEEIMLRTALSGESANKICDWAWQSFYIAVFGTRPQPVSPAAPADAEIKAGQVKTYDSMDQLIDDLPAAPAEQGDGEPRLVQLARVIHGWYREGSDAHQAASKIIADYEADDAMLRRENEQLREQLAATEKRLEWKRKEVERFVPCPDCRDKVKAGECERCKRQAAESRIAELTRQLADWWRSREALSSDCPSLGIDSAKWGDELARRCEPLRAFCNRYFNGKIPAEKGATNTLCPAGGPCADQREFDDQGKSRR